MSFRRSKEAVEADRDWRQFTEENRGLLLLSGIPERIWQSRSLFDNLLMHGYVAHLPEVNWYVIQRLPAEELEPVVELVGRYLAAGFPDPGVWCFPNTSYHKDAYRRAGLTQAGEGR